MEDFQALWFLEIHRDRALVSIHREKVRRFWGKMRRDLWCILGQWSSRWTPGPYRSVRKSERGEMR